MQIDNLRVHVKFDLLRDAAFVLSSCCVNRVDRLWSGLVGLCGVGVGVDVAVAVVRFCRVEVLGFVPWCRAPSAFFKPERLG